jgi:hypothetical protein
MSIEEWLSREGARRRLAARTKKVALIGVPAALLAVWITPHIVEGVQCAQLRQEHGRDIDDMFMTGPETAKTQPDSEADWKRYREELQCGNWGSGGGSD